MINIHGCVCACPRYCMHVSNLWFTWLSKCSLNIQLHFLITFISVCLKGLISSCSQPQNTLLSSILLTRTYRDSNRLILSEEWYNNSETLTKEEKTRHCVYTDQLHILYTLNYSQMNCETHLFFEVVQGGWVLFQFIVSIQLSFLCT